MWVEVAYALPEQQVLLPCEVQAGSTIGDVIHKSGLLQRYAQIDLAIDRVGIFGQIKTLEDGVSDGDRIEIYRPLTIDPKEVRRLRAARRKKATQR